MFVYVGTDNRCSMLCHEMNMSASLTIFMHAFEAAFLHLNSFIFKFNTHVSEKCFFTKQRNKL